MIPLLVRLHCLYQLPKTWNINLNIYDIYLYFIFQVDDNKLPKKHTHPFSHIATQVPLSVLADNLNLPDKKIPGELYPYMK